MAGGTRSYEMARRLVAMGHEVHVITTWREPTKGTAWFEEQIDGINVHWLPVRYNNAMGFGARLWAFLRFAWRAARRAVTVGGDLVFATSTPLTIAIPGVLAARRLRVPMVFEVRDLWPDIPIALGVLKNPLVKYTARCLERFAYSNSKRIVALSDGMAAGIVATGYPQGHVTVIPNSCDLQLFQYDAIGAMRFRQSYPELGLGPIVLYPGAIGMVNGVSYLAYLARGVLHERPDVRFVVFGSGAEESQLLSVATDLEVLGVNFFLYPPLPKRELVDAFSAAAVVISLVIDKPVLYANSANKFFDALASGTAVAINYEGWQAKLLEQEGAGIALGSSPQDAVVPMLELLSSPERIRDCGKRARMLAESRFDRDKLALRLERVFLEAIEK